MALVALAEGLTHFGGWHGDSGNYVDMVRLFIGAANAAEQDILRWHGILRPVVPLLASLFAVFVDPRTAIALVNLGFYFFGTYMTYLFTKRLLGGEAFGLVAAVAYASAPPNLVFGVAILTDGAGYAMLIASLYVAIFVLERQPTTRNTVWAGAIVGIGVLVKEVIVAIPLLLWLRFLFRRTRHETFILTIVCVVTGVIAFAWSFLVDKSLVTWYAQGLAYAGGSYNGILRNLTAFATTVERSYALMLPFAFLGFFLLKNSDMKLLCQFLAVIMLILVLWPTVPEYRFTFLTFPAVLPMAALGVNHAAENLAQRPILHRLSKSGWIASVLAVSVLFSNYMFMKWVILPGGLQPFGLPS